MPIKYVKGNIIDALAKGDIDVFAHGVNCMGGFGSGLAGEIARRLPAVRSSYHSKYVIEGWGLGQIQIVNITQPFKGFILNCATQKEYGRDPLSQPNGRYCSYEAIRDCMIEYHEICKEKNWLPAIPLIGCGLAGGDWKEVSKIVEEIFDDMTILVYYLREEDL